jgi:hypothetical protein
MTMAIIYYPNIGTVLSVAFAGDGVLFSTAPSVPPVTSSGSVFPTLLSQLPNTVLAGSSNPDDQIQPTFRALVLADLPAIAAANLSNGATGTGAVVLATGPTITGATLSGTFGGNPTFSGTPIFNNVPTFPSQTQNFVFAAPSGSNGTPLFRALVVGDIPELPASIINSGTLPIAHGGTGTATPGLVAGTNVSITGSWPNQTVAVSFSSGPIIVMQGLANSLTAAITPTTLYTPSATGFYRLSYVATVTTAATVSSTLGGANGFQMIYTNDNGDSNTKISSPTTPVVSSGNATGSSPAGTSISGTLCGFCEAGFPIQYSMGYTSSGATPMAYDLAVWLEFLGA